MDYGTDPKYGKKSIWKWIGIYVVVAVILYAAIYLVYKEVKNNKTDDSGSTTTQSTGIY